VCVLQGQQTEDECRVFGGRCISRSHSHTSLRQARTQVEDGMASWVGNAIRLEAPRRWQPRPSGSERVMVLQLVS
jgi:hypothetical protein